MAITPNAYAREKKMDSRALRWLIEFFDIQPTETLGRYKMYDEKMLDSMMERLKKAKEKTHS